MDKDILLVAINAKYIHSNLAVYSMRVSLGESGERVDIREYTINGRVEDMIDDIYIRKPALIGFSCYIWNIEFVEKIIVELHKLLPDCHIFLGGPEVSYNTDYYLCQYSFLKGVMVGEGEETFRDIVEAFTNKTQIYDNIPGICTHKTRVAIARNPIDMSAIPFPYSDLKEFENRIIYYESSRGCPFSCSYCLSSIDKKLRFRDIDLVEKELLFFIENKVPQVKFIDRTFNCDRERCTGIWRFIRDNDNGVTNFHFEISADLLTEEQLEILASLRPGLVQLEIGVQTTNENTIRAIRRRMDLSKLKEVVAKLRKPRNMHIHLDLIAGLPYEDIESFGNSFNEVFNMEPDELQLGFLKVLHGSYMHEEAAEYGIVYKAFAPYEVLYTKWMTYDDILSLKNTEEAVEIYYNSGQFVNSVKYLLREFDTPYQMFKALGEFYKNLSRNGEKHSRIERYNILLEFGKGTDCDIEVLKELLTFDIYVRENIKTRPAFSKDSTLYKEKIKELARDNEIDKQCHIEPISKNAIKYIDMIHNKEYKGDEVYLVFNYSERNSIDYNVRVQVLADKQ